MEESVSSSDIMIQIDVSQGEMLRGYDPLQEIYRWNLVFSLLVWEIIVVGVALVPIYNNLMFLQSEFWGIQTGILALLLTLFWGLGSFLLPYRRYHREKRQRNVLRRQALIPTEQHRLLTSNRLSSVSNELPLPLSIESERKKVFTLWIWLGALFFFITLGVNYLLSWGFFWELPYWLIAIPSVLGLLVVLSVNNGSIGRFIKPRVAGHYLLPSLKVDESGITARYGRDSIAMRWDDVRYCALVSSTTFHRIPDSQRATSSFTREAYEISDGENMICWLEASPFSSHRLQQNGEVALSNQQYTTFARQLASLVIERTGLPLYDFRPPERKAKKG